MKKRALSWLLALTMLLTLAPQTLPVWASATGEKSNTATQTESKLSANTYSALGLSRNVSNSEKPAEQPYGKAEVGNTIATNVINELYVNFNGSIHYGWSILDKLTMQWTDKAGENWTSENNSKGAMSYWRYGQQPKGSTGFGALYTSGGQEGSVISHIDNIEGNKSSSISSANKHLVYQYSKSEAFSPNTGKDNYVAELVVNDDGKVSLYIYQVEGGNKRYVRGTDIGKNPYVGEANNKTNIIWNWEYDAMFDIAAGDMDGDGYDEIAVYSSNKVYIYSYKNNALSKIEEYENTINLGSANGEDKYLKLRTAVVTLAFGDLNADDKEELVIAESSSYDSDNVDKGTVGIYALDGKKLHKEWSTDLKDGDKLIRYANVATGDIDGNYKDELVIAGYYSDNSKTATCKKDKFYYKIIKFKNNTYTDSGWKQTKQEIDLLQRVVDNSYQLIPPVSLTCAATQGVGHAEQLFLGGCLYTVNNDNSLTYLTRISTNREYKKDDGKKANKEEIFVVNVVAGNFNGNRYGQEQIIYAFGMKHDDSDRYWYDIGYINKKATGDTDATSSSGYWYGQEQVMNYESSYNRDQNKRRASLYLSLAAVDCDNDSTLMRYKGQEVTWTKPEVLTILQSAPYFQDLEDTRGYLNQSQTAYGKGNGITSSATAGGGLSIGTYVSFEQDFSVFGVKIASIEAEAQSKHSFNYSYEGSTTKTISVAYSGSAGDDYAIVYAVPFMEYQYETWVPGYTLDEANYNTYLDNYLEGKLGKSTWEAITNKEAERQKAAKELGITPGMEVKGSWQPSTVSVPMTPRTVILSVDSYDEIATQTEGLEPIRGNVLNSTPGDPSSYTKIGTSNGFKAIGKQQTVTNAEGSNTQIEGVKEDNQEHKFEYSYEFEAKAGVGAGGLTVGVLAGFEANAGGGTGKSESKTYTATVDNLPKDASGYTFDWQFGTREAELNGNPVLVLEYQLDNVNQLPSPPRNLRVEAVTSDSVTLQWDAIPGAGSYEIYQITSAGKKILVDTVPGTATSYTDTSVDPNNSYTYCMKNITKGGTASIFSTKAEAYTLMQNSGKFIIKKQPGENNTFSTYVGGTATATVQAEYLDQDGNDKKIHYTWEKYDTKSKEWVDYARGNTISISQVKDEMDGDKFRCQVYYNANLYIYTEPLTLEVGQAKSTTTLSSEQAGTTVNASYVETNEVKTGETKEVPVEVTVRNKKYTVYTTNDATVYLGEDGKYYSINGENATEISEESKNVQLTYTIKTGTGENTTEELKTISFDQLDPDTTFNGTTTPAVTYEYRDEESETAKTIYTANEKYTYAGHPTVEVYNCHENATEDKPASDFWFVKIGESKYAADVETTIVLKINDSKRIDVNDLVQSTTKEDATKSQQTYVEGTTVTLTANVNDANEGASDKPTGNVVFKIVNSVGDGSGTVTGTIGEDGVATATWKPSVAGVYTITAAYEGSEIHMGSASAGSITINVVVPGEKKLVIDSPNSMTYGDAAIDLKAMLLSGVESSGTEGKATDVTSSVTYSVNDAAIEGEMFNPTAAGTYTIKATYTNAGETLTATKTINVSKRTVKIVPKVENNVTSYTLENIVSADDSLFNDKIKVTCAGTTTGAAAGQYPINVTYTPGDKETDINSKYLVLVDTTQVYTVSDDVVQVTNATNNNNGTVTLQYIVNGVTYTVGSDGVVPKGAKLIATANPNKGYKVKQWKVNNREVTTGQGGTLNTTQMITVSDKVENAYTVAAEFELVYYTLNFNVTDGSKSTGSITANYLEGDTVGGQFTNGDQLSPLKRVQLTANVNSGQSIKEWQITRNNGAPETIKLDDDEVYTGKSYVLSSITANTKVTVLTENQTNCTVAIHLVDANGAPLVNQDATVSFNTNKVENTESGTYTYNGHLHDNLTVTLTLPDSLIVEEWISKEDNTSETLKLGNLSKSKKTWNISNLPKSLDLTVKCSTANSYTITKSIQVHKGTESENGGTLAVYQIGKTNEVSSVLQASSLRVVVTPNSGYQILDVTCNGDSQKSKLETNNGASEFRVNGVNENIAIVATFVKKPVISFSPTTGTTGAHGSVTANNSQIGGTVPYGSKDNIVFTATPHTGYEVATWTVNGSAVTGTPVANSDNQTYTYTPDPTTGITSDVTVTVTFKELDTHTITFSVVDTNGEQEEGGKNGTLTATAERKGMANYAEEYKSFTDGSNVYAGSTVTFTAKPADGYRVKEWQVDGEAYATAGTNTSLTLTPTKDTTVTVQFMEKGNQLTFNAEDANGIIESVKVGDKNVNFSGGFTLEAGATVTVTAKPNPGYEVNEWKVDGTPVKDDTGNTYVYTADGTTGAAISVTFQPVKYSITWGGTHGTVTAAGYDTNSAQIRGGETLTFTATPANGYKFDHWTVNGVKSEGAMNPLAWTVPHGQAETTPVNSYEIRAVFVSDEQTHTVTYTVNDAAGGTVTTESGNNGSITVAAGTNLTFTAKPNQYYHVQTWKLDGNDVDGSANQLTYTLNNVRAQHEVTVVFAKAVSYEVSYAVADGSGTISAIENDTALTLDANQKKAVKAGSKLVFTATPGTGTTNYMVEEWIVDNTPVTRTNMTELGVKMDHYLSNTLTIESLDKAVTVKVKFKTYEAVSIPTSDTGYMITTDKRIPMETYIGAPTNEIRKNGDLTFTVKPDGTKHYMTIGTLVINGYDCIANKVTDETKYNAKCDSVSAKKNDDGSYTVTITNVKDEVEKTIVAHQVIVGGLTVPAAFAGKEELNSAEKIRTKLEASFTGSKDGMAFYDIALKYYNGTQWVDVDGTNFPANGVDVVLPYPTGTDKQDRFQIVHMLTHSGHEGEIERIIASNETDGLHFHVNSLSPFGVSWTKYVAPTPGGGGGGGGGAVSTYTLTFDTNGGSAIDKITKDSGTTIDLAAYKPTRAGYTFAGWFSDKALTKAVTSVKLTANTTVYAKWTQNGGTAQNPFVDVKEGAYYYDAVLWAVEQKITSGTSATTFSPDASCTRAQMVTFLWRAAGSPKVENGKNPFADVQADAYYYDAVLWAVEKGVTSGTSATTFSPDATVTRGQTVTFLYRNAGSPEVSGTMPFTDVEADAYYAKAVQWAVQQKITTGTSETTFSPMSDCTRGQIVTFLYRAK